MTHSTTATTTHTTTAIDAAMGNGSRKIASASKSTSKGDVTKWSSTDVQHWIQQQCKQFELKKATAEKFEMNGQAFILLTKHDFLRRVPDGGEILYYALQRLINPSKASSSRADQRPVNNGSSSQQSRIVEITSDTDEFDTAVDGSSSKPIVEEPDDPPIIRRSQSDTHQNIRPQPRYPHPHFFRHPFVGQPVFAMPADTAAAFLHQQHRHPNAFMFRPPPPPHMHHVPPPHFMHHHQHHHHPHPMMSTPGILIEIIDELPTNAGQEQNYRVSMNGQQHVMNEAQVIQLLDQVHQQENLQRNQQQQQQFFQQQQRF